MLLLLRGEYTVEVLIFMGENIISFYSVIMLQVIGKLLITVILFYRIKIIIKPDSVILSVVYRF